MKENVVLFLIIFGRAGKWGLHATDEGYRWIEVAFCEGKKQIIQLDFAKLDRKFKGIQVLISAAIATDRGENERVVQLSK